MRKLLFLPITLPLALARGAAEGALRAAIEVLEDLADGRTRESEDPWAAATTEPEATAPREPDLAVVPEPDRLEPLAEDETGYPSEVDERDRFEPLAEDETGFPSEVEPADLLEPRVDRAAPAEPPAVAEPPAPPEPPTPAEVAEELGLLSEAPTRGQAAELREREREAEAMEDSPGAVVHVDEPWDGYQRMAAADVVDRLRVADEATKAVVLLYEEQHRARKSVLAAARGDG